MLLVTAVPSLSLSCVIDDDAPLDALVGRRRDIGSETSRVRNAIPSDRDGEPSE